MEQKMKQKPREINLERDFLLRLFDINYENIVFRTSYSNKGKQRLVYISNIEIEISEEEFIMFDKLVNVVEKIRRKRIRGAENG